MEAEKVVFQTEAEWLKFRKGGIGGSEAPTILGVNPYQSPLDLWAEKRGLVEGKEQTEQMAWGRRLQKAITEGYEEETKRKVMDQGIHTFVNKKHEFIRYSADGLILQGPGDLTPWIFEAKNTGHYTVQEIEDELPLHFQVQVQHGLFCLGLQMASIAILIRGNQLRWKDIERNDAFIEQMIEKEREFWRMVQSGTPPDADYRESTKDTISKLYPKDTGATVQLPPGAMNWAEQLFDAKAKIKVHEKIRDEQENKLKMAIGDNTFGILPNGGTFSWKWQERKAYEVKATEFRVLRRKGK
ncbi:hypothetical protein LCGC14_1735490 [marine sediment metagenome]|uniref:YqaJ viral recombinase domain-containing protein n=1 Tax=marine sediment metagenome TaxID=412755 RepID=A0A0F9JNR1_9ZZZZ